MTTEVKLSINVKPKFPKRCIVCSGKNPEATVGVGDLMVGWFSFFTDIPEGWGQMSVPVHADCRHPFRLRRWLGRLALFGLAFLALWLLGDRIEALLPDPIRRLGTKVVLALIVLPFLVVVEIVFPVRFDISVTKYYVTFEFADPRYAAAFAKCNRELRRYEEIKATMGGAVGD